MSKVYGTKEYVAQITTHDDKVVVVSGEGVDDMFTVTQPDDSVSTMQGAKGNVQFNVAQNNLSQVDINLLWESDANEIFQYLHDQQKEGNYIKNFALKRNPPNGDQAENIHVMKSPGVDQCMITKPADQGLGREAAERPWSFMVEGLTWPSQAPA